MPRTCRSIRAYEVIEEWATPGRDGTHFQTDRKSEGFGEKTSSHDSMYYPWAG